MHTRTHAHRNTHLCVRVGLEAGTVSGRLLQQMAARPRAKSKYGQQTHNCCQSREERDVKGPKCPLQKQVRIHTNDFIHLLDYQSNCKRCESFKGPAAVARCSTVTYLPQLNLEETSAFSVKDGQSPPTSSIKRERHTKAGRQGQQCDETRKAKHN